MLKDHVSLKPSTLNGGTDDIIQVFGTKNDRIIKKSELSEREKINMDDYFMAQIDHLDVKIDLKSDGHPVDQSLKSTTNEKET